MKKILIITMLVICLLAVNIQAYAVLEVGQMNVYAKAICETLLTYQGVPISTTYVVYNNAGIEYPAYCLDVNLPGVEEGEYVVNASDKIKDTNIWRAIINGYPYKSLEELGAANGQEAFTATKQAVYTMIYNRDISEYGAVDSESGRRTYQIYCNIVNAARNMNDNIVENIYCEIIPISTEWQIDSENTIYISKEYKITANYSNGSCEISLTGTVPNNSQIVDMSNQVRNNFNIGETFKIKLPITELISSENFIINGKIKLGTKPVMYGATTVVGRQDYALTGFMYEEENTQINQTYEENETKLIINKINEETEEVLEGVKFKVLNAEGELFEEFVTNESGQVIIENILPGKYFIKEVERLSGYEILEELIEITVEYGEAKEITITNKEIPKIIEEPEEQPTEEEEEPIEVKEEIEEVDEILEIVSVEIPKVTIGEPVKKLPKTGF